MSDTEGMSENMGKGRGIIRDGKDPFQIIGANKEDRDHPLLNPEPPKRGRPTKVKEENFKTVGPDAQQENNG